MVDLDLHRVPHSKAIEMAEEFILTESQNFGFSCRIITGNSVALQKKIIEEVINKHKFNYLIPNHNLGVIIVS